MIHSAFIWLLFEALDLLAHLAGMASNAMLWREFIEQDVSAC